MPVVVRPFERRDAAACKQLYQEGPLQGGIAPNDTGLDIDDIEHAYMRSPGSHFWVAEDPATGQVVGMVGLHQHEQGAAEIRRLRVRGDTRRRGIGSALMRTALQFCRERNFLKVTLDTFMEREPAISLFEKFHFKLSRSRDVEGKTLLYFYLDIYSTERKPRPE